MLKRSIFIVVLGLLSTIGCTDNDRVKKFGGSMTIEIPANKKIVNATWKNNEIWYLTRPRQEGETAETWQFQEKSSFGIIEGTIIFSEK